MKIINAEKLIELLKMEFEEALEHECYLQSADAIERIIKAVKGSIVEAINISYTEPDFEQID